MVCVDPTLNSIYLLDYLPDPVPRPFFFFGPVWKIKIRGLCWIRRLLASVRGAEHVRGVHVENVQRSS